MIEQKMLNRIAYNSKEFFCKGGDTRILVVRDYWDRNNEIAIDLTKLTPEIYEQIKANEEEEDYEENF